MSDLGRREHFARAQTQLPVHAYFDEALFRRELETLFARGPGYVGHELMVPEAGDYYALPTEREGRVLVRSAQGIELLSNVCRHRQAIMLKGRGNTENIVCPLHRWTYDLQGGLLGAPHFAEQPCVRLASSPLQNWQGLLFAGPRDVGRDLGSLTGRPDFDFSGYMLDHVEVHECAYNWKTFIEVYLEDYHVEPFHPGLGGFVSCEDLSWEFGEWHSVQTVGIHKALRRPGTSVYRHWHEQVLRRYGGVEPPHGAVWLTYYPNVMVEWYPNVLVISTLIPRGPRHTTNYVEFYYPEEIVLFERGESDAGPYQSPMEDGMQHFHEFLRRELGPI